MRSAMLESNRLLARLPESVRARLRPLLVPMAVSPGFVLYEARRPIEEIYFPVDCVVVLLHVTREGTFAELAIAGNEALVGVTAFTDNRGTPSDAVALTAGVVYRASAEELRREFALGGAFQRLVLGYTQALLIQVAQTAVCNRHHTLYEQLCRWLLLSLDRLPSNEVHMTQESIANMLGVRREGVTLACRRLRDRGIVQCSRGKIVVLERAGLEDGVCECYTVIREEYAALLEDPPPWRASPPVAGERRRTSI